MRIAIFGSYNGKSIGDSCILLGLISALQERFPDPSLTIELLAKRNFLATSDFSYFGIHTSVTLLEYQYNPSGNSSISKFIKRGSTDGRMPSVKDLANLIRGIDHMIIGGGNLIMDLYPKWPILFERICLSCIQANVPYSILGVGCGPVRLRKSAKIFEKCLMRAKEVGVRSEGALRIARRLAPEKHLRIVPDFALYLRPKKVCSGRKGIKRILAVNIAGVGSPVWPKRDPSLYQEYLERCVRWSCDLIERNSISQVTMLCTNHIDLNAERDFSSLILCGNADLSVVRTHPSFQVWPLFEIAGQSNIALTTRLHAGLISLLGGAAVSAFPYQPKVFDVFDGLALDNDYSTDIPREGRGNEDSTFSYPRKISDEALQRCRHDIRICFDRVFSNKEN